MPKLPAQIELDALCAAREAAVAPYRAEIERCEAAVVARLQAEGVSDNILGLMRRDAACNKAWDDYYEVWFIFSDRIKPLLEMENRRASKATATKALQHKARRYDGCRLEARAG